MHRWVAVNVPKQWRDTSIWPRPPVSAVPSQHLDDYKRRCDAITDYLRGEPVGWVSETYGVSPCQLYELMRECLLSDGPSIRGFAAAVPYARSGTQKRVAPPNADHLARGRGAAGLFLAFLSTHQPLQAHIDAIAEKYSTAEWERRRLPVKSLHDEFLRKALRLPKVSPEQYPFNIPSRGREAFREALHRAIAIAKAGGVSRLTESIWRKFRSETSGYYRRVQLDAHQLDAFVEVRVEGKKGRYCLKKVRPWLLVAIEVESTAALGWHLTVAEEPSSTDVLMCLYDMLREDDGHRHPEIPEFELGPTEGLPAWLLPGFAGRMPDVIELDNALAHHADAVRKAITGKLCASIAHGRAYEPRTRCEIEQLFNTITHHDVQLSIMGIRPDASAAEREAAMRAAGGMTPEAMEAYLWMVLGRYNDSPASGQYGRKRLECLRTEPPYALKRVDISPTAPWRSIVTLEITTKICAYEGHPPHVNLLNASYSNALMREAFHLVGEYVTVTVNLMDVRKAMAWQIGGIKFGALSVLGPWSEFPHDYRKRAVLARGKDQKRFHFVPGKSPGECAEEFLARVSRESRALTPASPKAAPRAAAPRADAPRAPGGRAVGSQPHRAVSTLVRDDGLDLSELLKSVLEG